jgi:hypothetical protein
MRNLVFARRMVRFGMAAALAGILGVAACGQDPAAPDRTEKDPIEEQDQG